MKERVSRWWGWCHGLVTVLRAYVFGSEETRWGLVALGGMMHSWHTKGERCPHGVQVVLWLIPKASQFGSAGFCEPMKEDGTGTISGTRHPRVPQGSTAGNTPDGGTLTWTIDCGSFQP